MNTISKRISLLVASAMALCLAAACLFGCTNSEPKNAQEVFDNFSKQKQDSYHIEGPVDLSMGMMGLNVPLDMKVSFDVKGYDLHGTVSSKDGTSNMDVYVTVEDGRAVMYTKGFPFAFGAFMSDTTNLDQWLKTTTSVTNLMDIPKQMDKTTLNDAEFEKTRDGYAITFKGKKIYEKALATIDDSEALAQINAVSDMFDKLNATFEFDTQCKFTRFLVPTASIDVSSGEGDANYSIQLTAGADLKISDMQAGTSITVPEDVVKSAIDVSTDSIGSGFGI
ncbi:MAG: hypothetical protein IJH04_01810 [Eggerthellaceae bacterium]|nr:hypothetical protein [Eggerthellaceae bacterium]